MVVAATAPPIVVQGNVEGSIVVGDHNFVVNTNYGTIVNKQAAPRVKLRDVAPVPPRSRRDFVGRKRELSELEQLVAHREAAVVFGPDGLGKTTLVKQVANGDAARACPNGVVYLEGVDEQGTALGLGDVIQRLFDALYESDPPLKVNAASARTYLSNTKPLVVLDRLTLPSSALDSLSDLFPQGALLTTSTEASAGGNVSPVKLTPLARADALQLFATKAGIPLDDANRATYDSLCQLFADVPLAIVTAANVIREKQMPLEKACQMIVSTKPPSADPVRAGIERAFALTFAMLSPEERHLFSVAAAAPGVSLDRAWLEKLDGGQTHCDTLEAVGLVQANSPRLRVPPGLRGMLPSTASEQAAKEQLLTYLRQTLATRSLDFSFVADELGNLLALHEWAFAQQRWADVIAIGQAVDPYLTLRGLWDAWRTVLDRVLRAARARGDSRVEAWALHQLGTREIGAGEKKQAIALLQQALALRQSIGDVIGAAHTQHNLNLLLPPPPPSQPPRKPPSAGSDWSSFAAGFFGTGLVITVVAAIVAAIFLGPRIRSQFGGITEVTVVTETRTPTNTPTDTVTPTPSITPTSTGTPTSSPTPTSTSTTTPSTTPSITPTNTRTPSSTPTSSRTATRTPTPTWTPIPGALRGSIFRAADALPINNAVVQLSNGQSVATSGSSYLFATLPPGYYTVSVSAPGYYPQNKSATIPSRETTTLNFSLLKAPVSSLPGRVTLDTSHCFDFDKGVSLSQLSSGGYSIGCPAEADISWGTLAVHQYPPPSGIRAANSASVGAASPQANAYESCMDITQKSIAPSVGQYVCVLTTADQIAVMRISSYDSSQVTFDWWRY